MALEKLFMQDLIERVSPEYKTLAALHAMAGPNGSLRWVHNTDGIPYGFLIFRDTNCPYTLELHSYVLRGILRTLTVRQFLYLIIPPAWAEDNGSNKYATKVFTKTPERAVPVVTADILRSLHMHEYPAGTFTWNRADVAMELTNWPIDCLVRELPAFTGRRHFRRGSKR